MFVMLSGRPPFGDDNLEDAVLDQAWSLAGPEWNVVSDQAKDFVKQLMMYNPKDRLSAEGALAHPWITGLLPEPVAAVGTSLARKDTAELLEGGVADEVLSKHHSAPSTLDLLPEMTGDDDDDATTKTSAAAVSVASRSTADTAQPRHHSDPVNGSNLDTCIVRAKRDREEGTDSSNDTERPLKRPLPDAGAGAVTQAGETVASGGAACLSDRSQEDSQYDSMSLSQSMIDDEVGWIWLWCVLQIYGFSIRRVWKHISQLVVMTGAPVAPGSATTIRSTAQLRMPTKTL